MADVSYTSTNVKKDSGPIVESAVAGEAITAGNAIYVDKDDSLVYQADADATSAGIKPSSADRHIGVALNTGAIGQTIPYLTRVGDKVAYGTGTFSVGQWYVVSSTAGNIMPASDLVASLNEVQDVTVSAATTGTFTLTFDGQTTAAIAFNAAAADVKTALEALSNIDAVACTGGPLNSSAVSVEFQGVNAAKDVVQMTATNSTDGTVSISTVTSGVAGDYSILVGYAESSAVLELFPKRTGMQVV